MDIPAEGTITSFAKCAGCERSLLQRKVLKAWSLGPKHPDLVVTDSEYSRRPWAAVVHSRVKLLGVVTANPEDSHVHQRGTGGLTTAKRLPSSETVQVREFPMVCSRACLDAVRANSDYTYTTESSVAVRVGASLPPDMKDGDDYLTHAIGAKGPMPAEPSDEWVVINREEQ